jgi:indolepyruvate ferredoxin oxidoreductase beta subunit
MYSNKKIDQFNMVIAGTGGQGLITLLQIIAEAVLFEGLDIRTSELHGLSQRGGSVEVHIKFGKKVYSPLIPRGRADLILGLEMQETLREANFANQKTIFLVNKKIIPIPLAKNLTEKECLDGLKKISRNITLIPASEICKEKLGTDVVSGIYLISLAVFKGLIPIKPASIEKAIRKIIPARYLELNLKTFKLAKN